MSLTASDLSEIRDVIHSELHKAIRPIGGRLDNLEGRVEALENDIKEIYQILTRIERLLLPDKDFQKLSIERRLLKVNRNLLLTAKEAGVSLPR